MYLNENNYRLKNIINVKSLLVNLIDFSCIYLLIYAKFHVSLETL